MARSDSDYAPSNVLPQDEYSLALRDWIDRPATTRTKPALVQLIDHYGHGQTWVVQTHRHNELGETVFVTKVAKGQSLQLHIPPEVVAVIVRQHDAVTTMNRRKGARQAMETRRQLGLPVGNPEALAKARKRRSKR